MASAAQSRIIDAALELFARHGVGGTSLQMIADEIGVTKAAVYHQYKTKDEIVLAVAESELARVAALLEPADAEASPEEARDALLLGIVDLAIERGRKVGTLLTDPIIGDLFADHRAFHDVMHRMRHVLLGKGADAEAGLRTAMLLAAISGAAMHPFSAEFDDDVLRAQLVHLARSFLGLPA